ncbi:putative non-specific serine/threonine protein kinase [Helianthus anomalus]
MKLGLEKKTGLNRMITSWKSSGNPGVGDYSYKLELVGSTQMFLFKGMTRYWRAGSWNGLGWSGVPCMTKGNIFIANYINNDDEVTIAYHMRNPSMLSRVVATESGTLERLTWHESDRKWIEFWFYSNDQCDVYNHCGPFGFCDPNASVTFECDCLPGYESQSPQDWYIRDGSKGCKRKVGIHMCDVGDGFVELAGVKIPDTFSAHVNMSLGLKACEELCLRNCTCKGYASADISKGAEGGGCIMWHGCMNDTRTFLDGGQSLYMRLDAAELGTLIRYQYCFCLNLILIFNRLYVCF